MGECQALLPTPQGTHDMTPPGAHIHPEARVPVPASVNHLTFKVSKTWARPGCPWLNEASQSVAHRGRVPLPPDPICHRGPHIGGGPTTGGWYLLSWEAMWAGTSQVQREARGQLQRTHPPSPTARTVPAPWPGGKHPGFLGCPIEPGRGHFTSLRSLPKASCHRNLILYITTVEKEIYLLLLLP